MRPDALRAAIAEDRAAGRAADRRRRDGRHDVDHEHRPGRGDRGDLPRRERVAARGRRVRRRGGDRAGARGTCSPGPKRADSLVVNPHKWLFTPFDLSAFYCRRMDVLRRAFSLVPEYLRTTGDGAGART